VLVHGSNASLHTWEPWVALLGDRFRIITFDLPGHGLTGRSVADDYSVEGMVDFVDEVTRALGVQRFHLGGNSMGGRVVWNYALDHAQRVDRLILVDASGYPDPPDMEESLGFRLARTPGLRQLMRFVTPRSVFEVSLKDGFSDPSLVTDAMVTRYYELQLREGSREASIRRYGVPDSFERLPELSSLRRPTLILWGEDDRMVPVAHAHRFDADIPNTTLRVHPGVGHIPMEEAADATAADVRAFLTNDS